MAIDLNSLSTKELSALINEAKKRKTTLAKRKPLLAVRKKLTQIAKVEGYTIAELFGDVVAPRGRPSKNAGADKAATRKPRKTAGTKVAPKYRNPSNSSETWTGRGKQPRWLAAQTGAGRKLEEFLIQ